MLIWLTQLPQETNYFVRKNDANAGKVWRIPRPGAPLPCRGPSFLVSARKEAKKPTGEALNAGQLPRQSRPPRTPPGAHLGSAGMPFYR